MSTAKLHTNHGTIAIEFFDADAPKTVENFRDLAADNFYEGLALTEWFRTVELSD